MYYTDIYNTKLLISFFWRNISVKKYVLKVYFRLFRHVFHIIRTKYQSNFILFKMIVFRSITTKIRSQ